MKKIHKLSFLFACLIMSMTAFMSCDFDGPADPDHPLFVEYTISASFDQFTGPEQLQIDVKKWIDENQIAYVREINYNSSDPSVYEKDDAEAIEKYNAYKVKFNNYLNDLKQKLNSGTYGAVSNVNIPFYVFAKRTQGDNRYFRNESIPFVYTK